MQLYNQAIGHWHSAARSLSLALMRRQQQHTQAGDSYAAGANECAPVNTQLIINNIAGGLWGPYV